MYRILVASTLFDDLDDLLTAMETAQQLSLDTGAQIAVYRLGLPMIDQDGCECTPAFLLQQFASECHA
ncbi:hypothetical protein OEZ71_13090 [Defluviimonas sp. WL0050]|uniref:Uncharacterized protein n=1 Tax=Albidovulum litorale TaxID=2984134 RepID=A0ABT2ZQ00_9RHOB|nr:hypothetical protein [Defluviimonas sp. WL0050]MCV2873231.1 hypothetical protein [Defluviimonas sp. WL0050]